MKDVWWGWGSMVGVAVACASCGGSQQVMLGTPVRSQVAVVVRISDEVNQADNAGGVAELVETIEAGLKEHGITSEVYTDRDDHPPPPRIELNVVYWSERNTTARNLSAAGAVVPIVGIVAGGVGPANRMIVDCQVVMDASGRPRFQQRFESGAAAFGRDEASAGGKAGSAILWKLFGDGRPAGPTAKRGKP